MVAFAGAPPSSAQTPPPVIDDSSPDGTVIVHDPRVDDALATVPVVGGGVAEAYGRFRDDRQAQRVARDDETRARRELADLAAARTRLEATVNRSTRRRDKSAAQVEVLRRGVGAIAVEDYVQGAAVAPVELDMDPRAATDARARRAVSAMVRGRQLDDLRANTAVVAEATADLDNARAELDDVGGREHESTAALNDALARQARLATALDADARAVGDARLTAEVRGADFVLVALDAYHRAAARLAAEQPSCGLRWPLLAGIGRTESGHGTFRGARLEPDGTVSRPIIGIPLDGANGTVRIPDTDGGRLDGDPVLDRAVGPLQFIPSTWSRWAGDANGDGQVDPQNLYDAALAAARYLCNAGGRLDTDAGRRTAVYAYNTDDSYVSTVLSRADAYERLGLANG